MAEVNNPVNPDVAPSSTDDKLSNKTFSQSEFDQMVARKEKEILARFKDYDEVKKTAEQLATEKKERELAEKTEVEKLQLKEKELTERLSIIESEKKKLEVLNVKNDVLSKSEYSVLPRAYKSMVEGDTAESILASADNILKEYEQDVKKVNPGVSYRPPVGGQAPSQVNKSPAELIKDAFAAKGLEHGVFRPK